MTNLMSPENRMKSWMTGALFAMLALTGCTHSSRPTAEDSRWLELFDGDSLTGWTQVNGDAPYTVVEGAIRGTNVFDSPNSFLATDERFSDFVLEFESRSIGGANSGVQFRTDFAPGTWSGVVGYQLDIDPTDRKWTGGVYHEGVHRWRHAMARNPACQAAYQHGAWNAYRIEAVGSIIATWVNNIPCAHMVGDHHEEGVLALQVHAIGQEAELLGSFTEWRNLKLLNGPGPDDLWLDQRADLVEGWLENQVSKIETENGWSHLDFERDATSFETGSGEFEIVIDIKLDDAAEGILDYRIDQAGTSCAGQYALLNDVTLGEDRPASSLMGSFPGEYEAENLSEPGRPKRIYSDERWNRVRVLVTENEIEHWLNGVKVLTYPKCDQPEGPNAPNQATLKLVTKSGVIETRSTKIRTWP